MSSSEGAASTDCRLPLGFDRCFPLLSICCSRGPINETRWDDVAATNSDMSPSNGFFQLFTVDGREASNVAFPIAAFRGAGFVLRIEEAAMVPGSFRSSARNLLLGKPAGARRRLRAEHRIALSKRRGRWPRSGHGSGRNCTLQPAAPSGRHGRYGARCRNGGNSQ